MKKQAMVLWGIAAAALLFGLTGCGSSPASGNAQTSLDNGKRLFDQQNYAEAIQELTEAIRLNPKMAEAYAYRSWAHGRSNNNEQALADANEAIRIKPRLGLGYFVRGRLQSDNDSAIADYDQAIKFDPKNAGAYLNRGYTYSNKKDYDRAIADYTQAIKFDPKLAMAYNNRGLAYNNKNDYDHAIADFTDAIKIDPNYGYAYDNRGWAYLNKKDYDHAIADYTQAIKFDPKDASAYINRGLAYANKKDYDSAIADYTESIRLDPKKSIAYSNRGLAYKNKKDYDNAIADFKAALQIDPNNTRAKDNLTQTQRLLANQYDRTKFTVVSDDFAPSDFTSVDLFKAVTASKDLQRASNKDEAVFGQALLSVGGGGNGFVLQYVSDVTFMYQDGTTVVFSSDDKVISQSMTIDQRAGLQAGQKVRVYYTVMRAPLMTWDVEAIERR